MSTRYICYTGPIEQLELAIRPARRRGELDHRLCVVHDSLMRLQAERGRLDQWAAIAAAVALEAGFQIGRRYQHFGARETTRRIVGSEPRQ